MIEAVQKFKQLARLCPHMVKFDREEVQRMMKMLRTDLAIVVSNSEKPPTTVEDYISRAVRVEY